MKATVTYDGDAEPIGFEVEDEFSYGTSVKFTMDGSSAIATGVSPAEGEEFAYFDDISAILEYVESLPFVQAVAFDEYDGECQ